MRSLTIIIAVMILGTGTLSAIAQTRLSVEDLDKQVAALNKLMETGSGLYPHQVERLLGTLAALPASDDRRLAALAIAGRYANAQELSARAKKEKDPDIELDMLRLNCSWRILQSLHVIREGAHAEDLVPFLGAPKRWFSPDGAEIWQWSYSSMMHVNPALGVKVKNGLVVESKFKSV